MARFYLQTRNGERIQIEAASGTVMQAAVAAGVPGIDADCGGSMVCGTCHVYLDRENYERLSEKSDMEGALLEGIPRPHPRARLACQLAVSDALNGLVFEVPPAQR